MNTTDSNDPSSSLCAKAIAGLRSWLRLLLLALILLCGSIGTVVASEPPDGTPIASSPGQALPASDRGAGVDAYATWLSNGFSQLAPLIPAMTESAETAAKLYIDEGWDIGVIGDPGAYFESSGRSGGLMTARAGWSVDELAEDKAIVILSLRDDQWRRQIHKDIVHARELSQSGRWKVIGLGRADLIEKAEQEGVAFIAKLPIPAPPGVGLFEREDGTPLVPTTPALKVAAMWMWFGEFVGACTRRGEMPPMYMGYALEGGAERAEQLSGMRLHKTAPPPIEAGKLAKEYLRIVREEVQNFFEKERENIIEVACTLGKAHASGKKLWGFYHNHALIMGQNQYPLSPMLIQQLSNGWFDMRVGMDQLGESDVIFCIGFDRRFNGWKFESWDQDVRATGATLLWSFAARRAEDIEVLEANNEPLIEQHWAHGDAVVEVPGYDIRILPSSGVICHAVLWSVNAELVNQVYKDARVAAQ